MFLRLAPLLAHLEERLGYAGGFQPLDAVVGDVGAAAVHDAFVVAEAGEGCAFEEGAAGVAVAGVWVVVVLLWVGGIVGWACEGIVGGEEVVRDCCWCVTGRIPEAMRLGLSCFSFISSVSNVNQNKRLTSRGVKSGSVDMENMASDCDRRGRRFVYCLPSRTS